MFKHNHSIFFQSTKFKGNEYKHIIKTPFNNNILILHLIIDTFEEEI